MNLKEVCEKASHKDLLECEIFGDKQEFILWFNQILTRDKRLPVFISDHFKTNTWQIIPAKKEPMTAGESFYESYPGKSPKSLPNTFGGYVKGFKVAEENTHLLYVDLIKKIQSWIDSYQDRMPSQGIAVELCKELKKIKQHKEQDGNK